MESLGGPEPLSLAASPFLTGGGTPMSDLGCRERLNKDRLREKYVYLEGERKARVYPKYKRRRKRRQTARDYVTVPASETASADDETTGKESRRETNGTRSEEDAMLESMEDTYDETCINGMNIVGHRKIADSRSHRRVTGINELSYTVICEKNSCGKLTSAIRTISEQLDQRDSNKNSPSRYVSVTDENCVDRSTAPPDGRCAPATSTEENVTMSRKRKCANCCRAFLAFLCSTIGLSCLMVGYVILGGFIFQGLEAPNEMQMNKEMLATRNACVQQLWELTEALNVLHPENWSSLAENILENYTAVVYMFAKKKGWDGKAEDQELQWSFAGALLYSITVVTTIGQSRQRRQSRLKSGGRGSGFENWGVSWVLRWRHVAHD